MTRGRGNYGPLDRDRHWAIGWSADRAATYAQARAVGAVLRPVLPTVLDVARAQSSADRWWTTARAIGGRTQADRPSTAIGQELFHGLTDRTRAISQITASFRGLASDLAIWQTTHQDHPEASVTAQWIAADVTPALDEWNKFVSREQQSWWTKAATSWDTFEQWADRVKQMRSLARARGITLQSADPAPLPKTLWQRGEEGKGSEATAILGVLKIGALSALALMGAAGLYSAVRNLGSRAQQAVDREALREVLREELHEHSRR